MNIKENKHEEGGMKKQMLFYARETISRWVWIYEPITQRLPKTVLEGKVDRAVDLVQNFVGTVGRENLYLLLCLLYYVKLFLEKDPPKCEIRQLIAAR